MPENAAMLPEEPYFIDFLQDAPEPTGLPHNYMFLIII